MTVLLEYKIPGKVCQGNGRYLCARTGLNGEVGRVGDDQRGRCCLHGGDFVGQARLPGFVKMPVRRPGCVDIDLEGAVLDTADVLLFGTMLPLDRQAVAEKRGWDRSAEDDGQIWYEGTQSVEYRHHLRRVTVAMSGDGTPNAGQDE